MRGLSPLSVCVVRPRVPCPRALDDVRPGGETRAESGDRACRVGLSRPVAGLAESGSGDRRHRGDAPRRGRGETLSIRGQKTISSVSDTVRSLLRPVPYGVTGHTSHDASVERSGPRRAEGGRERWNFKPHQPRAGSAPALTSTAGGARELPSLKCSTAVLHVYRTLSEGRRTGPDRAALGRPRRTGGAPTRSSRGGMAYAVHAMPRVRSRWRDDIHIANLLLFLNQL